MGSTLPDPAILLRPLRDREAIRSSDIDKLVAAGILKELPNQHPKTYLAPEVFAIAYEGLD